MRRNLRHRYATNDGKRPAPSKTVEVVRIDLDENDSDSMHTVGIKAASGGSASRAVPDDEETAQASQRSRTQSDNGDQLPNTGAAAARPAPAAAASLPHTHSYPLELQEHDEATGVTRKRCTCGFTIEVEEM